MPRAIRDGANAWPGRAPLFSYETVGTASHVIRDYLGPAILGQEIRDLDDLTFAPRRVPRPSHGQGGTRARVRGPRRAAARQVHRPCHRRSARQGRSRVSLGIQPSVDALDERVNHYLGLGYRRIKLKIKAGR